MERCADLGERENEPGRGNGEGKGSEVGLCLVCWKSSEERGVAEEGGELGGGDGVSRDQPQWPASTGIGLPLSPFKARETEAPGR